ncbi:hypothetical protein F0562_031772 [Nyssa sinensis]|uniref:ABC transporter domain-containing protein n=1 Tax=Nyssa sinensis TaxID=561372 RepID=A0A5J5AT42_9ASTE|nr:hypothetical protein F0562_031772 [Nyssa sinensis]
MERFYDPTLGEVLLDGENIKNLKLEWLRSQIGLVTQEPALLSLSIRDNIAYGRSDATLDQIEEAAKIAHVHTFISSLEKGYETQVGRAGLSLTEEQKIKLSVARAVLSNPSILLLDEVTGGLDFEAERYVQEALDLLMLGRSTIIIARRLSLIKNADYIAVMEEGQLVEMGTHDELVTTDGLYAELLRCEEAAKLPRRMPIRNYKETATFQIEKDSSASHSFEEPSSPKMAKSPSLQRVSGFQPSNVTFNSQESPRVRSPPPEKMAENGVPLDGTHKEPSIRRQDSFEMMLPELPKIDVQSVHRQTSNASDPESPVSPLLTSDPKNERSHSQTFSRPLSQSDDMPMKRKEAKDARREAPSFWRLVELSFAEWLYAVLGSIGAAIFGSFNPLLAYVIALVVTAYYRVHDGHEHHLRQEVDKWCLIIVCMGIVTVVANFLQHFYFGIMGEKMTERVRRMMFSAMLRNEVGCNRLSIFIQDTAAVVVAVLIGMLLQWRLALVALATLPILTLSAIAQKLWLAGFSKGIQEMHRKASLVLEDAVRNIYTVVAFCAVLKSTGGQTVAVVGVSGSGKSTIISLIERFYDPVAGQVLLDGRDLKLYNLRWLRNHMGLVQQEPIIFSTTIRENIIYARHNASEAEIKEAARIANAHHFISSLPHGYDTHVGMRGVDLTPGQKQRIAIARVVLKNAPILLLDEASSSIESESSRVVQEALDTLVMGNKTTILIAHRAGMMRHVDNIVVLNGGRIVEEGSHDFLVAKNGLYVRLMQPHFGKGLRQHRLV